MSSTIPPRCPLPRRAQEVGFYDSVRTGELMNRLSEDSRLMKSAGTVSISIFLRSLIVSLLGLGLMFATSWVLTLLTLAGAGLLRGRRVCVCACGGGACMRIAVNGPNNT